MADPEDVKRNYLHFVSSELTAHAAGIVGLSVLLFTCADLFAREGFIPKIHFPLTITISKITFNYAIVGLVFWMLASAVFYSFMRLTYYGALAHEIITVEDTKLEKMALMRKHCERKLDDRRIINWFSCGFSWKSRGMWFSAFVGFVVSLVMLIVLFVE